MILQTEFGIKEVFIGKSLLIEINFITPILLVIVYHLRKVTKITPEVVPPVDGTWQRTKLSKTKYKFVCGRPNLRATPFLHDFMDQNPLYFNHVDFRTICLYRVKYLEAIKLDPAHEKSHSQSASVRTAANAKAREDRVVAKEYRKQLQSAKEVGYNLFLKELKFITRGPEERHLRQL